MSLGSESTTKSPSIPRWQEIYQGILVRIRSGELAESQLLPTEDEIAREYSVSRLTAHRALYELQREGHVMRKRRVGTIVLPPPHKSPTTIAAMFFNVSDNFEAALFSGLGSSISDEQHLIYVNTAHDPMREVTQLRRMAREASGILLYPTCAPENDAVLSKVVAAGTPLVCIDRYPRSVSCDAVLTDNYGASRQAVTDLIRRGHRSIAHFTDMEPFVTSTAQRAQAYQDVLTEHGLDPARNIRELTYSNPRSPREYQQIVRLVTDALYVMRNGPEPVTAVFCLRDLYASVVADALSELGLRAGVDVELVSFMDQPDSGLTTLENLTRIEQDIEAIARRAIDRLSKRIDGDTGPPQRILVPAKISAPPRPLPEIETHVVGAGAHAS